MKTKYFNLQGQLKDTITNKIILAGIFNTEYNNDHLYWIQVLDNMIIKMSQKRINFIYINPSKIFGAGKGH